MYVFCFFFFFLKEKDGIGDKLVIGVQTCALPILEKKTAYKHYIHIFKNITKQAQTEYYSRIFDNKSNSTKKLWQNINSHLSLNKNCRSKGNLINKIIVDDKIITDPVSIADEFNRYFSTVGAKLAKNLQSTSVSTFNDFLPPSLINSFVCSPVTTFDILHAITKYSRKKQCESGFIQYSGNS